MDQGVRQGCTLSPWLILDTMVKEPRELGIHGFMDGVMLRNENADVLLFADDMVLIADSAEALQVNLQKLDETLTRWR